MNNQFATQFLREDREEVSIDDLMDSLRPIIDKAVAAQMDPEEIKSIIANAIGLNEDGAAAAAPAAGGGGSTTGGGTTNGATVDGGPEGEQYFAGTRRKKMEEDASLTAGGKEANISAYTSIGFKKAPSAKEAGEKMKSIDVEMLWEKEGEEVEVRWRDIEDHTKKLGRKLHGFEPDSSEEKYFLDYMKNTFNQGIITSPQSLLTTVSNYSDTVREDLNESRAYSKFRKETATRSKDQQMHEAVKIIHKKLEEVSKLVEFAKQMRTELSEGENALEYKHNTKKIFEKINSKVVEVYTKTRELK